MATMEISTNVACKVQCDFCPQELHIKQYSTKNKLNNITYGQPTQMSFDTFKKCLNKMPKSVKICFSGYTEPFLNPDCSKMIVYADENNYPVEICSTLVGLKEEDIKKIEDISFTNFFLHFPDATNHAKIAVNSQHLKIIKMLLASNIQNFRGMSMGKLHPKIEELVEKMEYSDEMISRCGTVENIEPIQKRKGQLSCTRATKTDLVDKIDDNVLLPNGDVTLCCMDFGLQNIIGNLLEISYEELFETEKYKEVDRKLKTENEYIMCRFCEQAMSKSEIIDRQKLKLEINEKKDKIADKIVELYQEKLNRYPDRLGFEHFFSKLMNKEMSLLDLEKSIMESDEYTSSHPPFIKLKID
jgi:hypothetical protein